MRITQWGEYGIHCAAFIASEHAAGNETVGAQEIADSQGIALDYAQQVLQRLRKGGIVNSVRGPQGGYQLARSAAEINLRDTLIACEGYTFEVICESKPLSDERCRDGTICALRGVWLDLREHVDSFLLTKTLADLARSSQVRANPNEMVQITRSSMHGETPSS